MKYYQVNMIKGEKREEFFINVFEFPDKKGLLTYFCENYPEGVEFHVIELDGEEAKTLRTIRKNELASHVRMAMSQVHWKEKE